MKWRALTGPAFLRNWELGIENTIYLVIARSDSDAAISRIYLKRRLPRLARLGSQ
jgi:hypothetical protein